MTFLSLCSFSGSHAAHLPHLPSFPALIVQPKLSPSSRLMCPAAHGPCLLDVVLDILYVPPRVLSATLRPALPCKQLHRGGAESPPPWGLSTLLCTPGLLCCCNSNVGCLREPAHKATREQLYSWDTSGVTPESGGKTWRVIPSPQAPAALIPEAHRGTPGHICQVAALPC